MFTALVAFLLLLIGLLAIPVALTFKVSWEGALEKDIELQWLFGLIQVRIPSGRSKALDPAKSREPAVEKAEQKARRIGRSRPKPNFSALVRQKAFRRRAIRFVRDMWRAVKKQDVVLRVRVGLGDPADTGQLWAVVGPMAGILASIQHASITVEPEFFDARLELDSSGSIRLIPLQIVFLTCALLLSPPVWQGLRQMRAAGR